MKLAKKIRGPQACLGDIVHNIAKIGGFLLIFRGEHGASFRKVALNRTNLKTFQLILIILNLTVQFLSRNK